MRLLVTVGGEAALFILASVSVIAVPVHVLLGKLLCP